MSNLDRSKYEDSQGGPQLLRMEGPLFLEIRTVGAGTSASWGYAIWREGTCLAGACNWAWDLDDAAKAAEAAMGKVARSCESALLPEKRS